MNTNQKKLLPLLGVSAVACCFLVSIAWSQPRPAAPAAGGAGAASAASAHPSAYDRLPKYIFQGSITCRDADCHGATNQNPDLSKRPGDEYNKWSRRDKHATKAYRSLSSDPRSKQMMTALKLTGAATASARCLGCHSLNAPKAQRDRLELSEGVTCTACHGPSEKWLEPHKQEGWGTKVRGEMDHDKLLQTYGLYDTRPPVARAELCVSCHLAIEADLIKAKHPQPVFELAYFTQPEFYTGMHWRDPKEPYFPVRLWSAGQIVSLRDALRQLEGRARKDTGAKPAEATTDAYYQAVGHYTVLKPFLDAAGIAEAKSLADQKAKLDAAVKTGGAALADAADAMADAADAAVASVDKAKPDQAVTQKVLADVAKLDMTSVGEHGREQQAFAIHSLYSAYASGDNKLDDAEKKNLATIQAKIFPPARNPKAPAGTPAPKIDAKTYAAGLTAVRPLLPKGQ